MWVFYAFFVAFSTSLTTLITKRLTHNLHPLIILFLGNMLIIPLMFLVVLIGGIPKVTNNFYIYILISAGLDSIAFVASVYGIKKAPVSLIAPVTSFNPVFTTIIAIFFLNEIPTPLKSLGILIIVFGAYILNIADIKHGLLKPFKKLLENTGVQLVFIATFLWSITPIFQKKAIFETSPTMPFFVSFVNFLILSFLIVPIVIPKLKKQNIKLKSAKLLLIFAPIVVLSQLAAYTAFSQVNVGYATAVFKLSVLFIILWGGLFFKEERIKERLLGAIVMILGTILIVI